MTRIERIREQLAGVALSVCQTYLPNGRRSGQYWVVGDIDGNKGRSLYVKLTGRAGKWTDSATGEHGDLLDIIAHTGRHRRFAETLKAADRFLSLSSPRQPERTEFEPDRSQAARRLFAASSPLQGTHAERYLNARGITHLLEYDALRFHPRCFVRDALGNRSTYPALIAAITDLDGQVTGVHRTWLSHDHPCKAPLPEPRRSLGAMIGNGVRFGAMQDSLIVGEGIETILSLRSVLPSVPAVAALTATHLGLLQLPPDLVRLYIARDNDEAGTMAWQALSSKAKRQGITTSPLIPELKDWNDDLRELGFDQTRARALSQLFHE